MRLSLLASGSSGNVVYVEASHGGHTTRLLIDAGLCRAEISRRLALVDPALTLDDIDAVLITHDHADHVGSAAKLGRPLYATAGTRRKRRLTATRVLSGVELRIGALRIMPVLLPHDADETVAFVLEAPDGARLAICTDCGQPTKPLAEAFYNVDLLVLESNYDPQLLALGPYPLSIQRRVSGGRGHLSNAQAAMLLSWICRRWGAPAQVVLAHLSRANNRPELALAAFAQVIDPARLTLATPHAPTPLYDIAPARTLRRRQMTFDFSALGDSA